MAKAKNYDSEFCGSLPLNHINVIQSYGYLIVLDRPTLKILQVSENITALFDTELPQIINKPLTDFIDTAVIQSLQERFGKKNNEKVPATFAINGRNMPALLHFKADYLILEVEKQQHVGERSFTSVFEEVKYAMAAIERADTIEDVSRAAISELRKLTGFDGMMMYRFDSEWNGTVIAEEKVPELENYLGHTFPASDVPRQARELYLKNPYRLIPDRDYQPVRLYPIINPVTHTFIDLSDCNLRGVAAVHLEYLKNMNVQASMSIRVIHQGQLWGLIACHHVTPHYLTFEICAVCELLSSVISNKITTIIYKENFDIESEIQRRQTALVARVYAEGSLLEGLFNDQDNNLMHLFSASGATAIIEGQTTSIGQVPHEDFMNDMVLWLQSKQINQVYASDSLPELLEDAVPYADKASGILILPIDGAKGDYLICFRPEVIQTIKWGGDPNQTINFEADGKNYHPRNSFKIWQQTVNHTSVAWSKQELEAAQSMRSFIYEYKTKQALA